ncbi:MAG: outer membrane beta-barrel protein [Gemmatimonadaceae bacterium]
MTRLDRPVRTCLVTALLCAASAASAQTWEAGLKTGISQSETPSDEFTWRGTSSSSLFFSHRLGGPFSISPEIAYFRRSGVSVVGASTLRLVADYIEVPVLLQAALRTASPVSPFVAAGPTFAYRFRCRLQFSGGGVETDEDCNARGEPSSSLDVGVAAGAGLAVSLGLTTISIESRMKAGLLRNVLPTDVSDARAVGWSVMLGASIPTSRRGTRPPPVWMPPRMPRPLLPGAPTYSPPVASSAPASAAPRVTITADNADARDVLLAIARLGGLDVVVSSQVQTRVTAHLIDVPADQAIQAIADVTGLGVLRPAAPGGATVVFHQEPVNVNGAKTAKIASRFGVSGEMAKFVAEPQSPRQP